MGMYDSTAPVMGDSVCDAMRKLAQAFSAQNSPFDPSKLPGLVLSLDWRSPNPRHGGAAATAGQTIDTVNATFGATNKAIQATGGLQPLFENNGGHFDNSGTQFMMLDTPVSVTDCTGYLIGSSENGGVNIQVLGASSGGGAMGVPLGSPGVIDDAFTFLQTNVGLAAGAFLIRFNVTGGNGSIIATGQSEAMQAGMGAITVDQLAISSIWGTNGDDTNRWAAQFIFDQSYALNSPQDLQMQAWILSNFGVSL